MLSTLRHVTLSPAKPIRRVPALAAALLSALLIFSAQAQTTVTEQTVAPSTPDTLNGLFQASDGNFYATGYEDQCTTASNCGGVYKVTPTGVVTEIFPFTTATGYSSSFLIEGSDGNFYDMTNGGGTNGAGTVFKLTPSGQFTLLHSFVLATDGGNGGGGGEGGSLVQGSDGNFYGVAAYGGPGGQGTIFEITPSGTFSVLYSFSGSGDNYPQGAGPDSLVVGSDGNFYGTTQGGGTNGFGTVFKFVPASGANGLTTLYSFTGNADGSDPIGTLVEGRDGNFYGMTQYDSFFKVTPAGNLTPLYTTPVDNDLISEGLNLGSDGNFYGAITLGGDSNGCTYGGCGTLFQLQPSGAFATIYNFAGQTDGEFPMGWVSWGSDGKLYSVTTGSSQGMETGFAPGSATIPGTVDSFALSPALAPPVQLTLSSSQVNPGSNVTLTWKVLNAFSQTMQQCNAFVQNNTTGAGTWSGPQTGTLSNFVYSGSATITPTADGTYTYALTCGGQESGFATLTVGNALTVSTTSLPIGTVGTAYSETLAATGGTAPYSWTITSGELPAGLSLEASNGAVSGTPEQSGTANVVVQVTDSANPAATATANLSLSVNSGLSISMSALPNGVAGVPYSQTLDASGGMAPYTWSVTSGALPAGLSLASATGIISGTPTATGTFPFSVQVTDSEHTPATATGILSLTVSATASASLTKLTSSSPTVGTGTNVTFTATVSSSGGVPAGTVTFYNGSTSIGTGTLANGVATLTTSFSTPGSPSITAVYAGNADYMGSTSAVLTETVVAAGVTATVSPTSLTVAQGASGTLTMTVTSQGGYAGAVNFSCATLPTDASCTFAPASITLTVAGGAVTDTVTINTAASSSAKLAPQSVDGIGSGIFAAMTLWLPASLAGFLGFSRRKLRGGMRRLWILAFLCVGLAGVSAITGCGGGSSGTSSSSGGSSAATNDTPAGTYSVPITLTLAGGTTQTVNATVIVQ